MDWNKYLYVRDNPINYTDPSGHEPCTINGPRYCYLSTGGYIDKAHFTGGKDMAKRLMRELLPSVFGKTYGQITLVQGIFPSIQIPKTNKRTPEISVGATYLTNLPVEGLPQDKLVGVALGIFMDFQIGYEKAQGIDPRCWSNLFYITALGHCSSFSNEDLPSDYLGFVSHVKPMPYEQIIRILDPSGGDARKDAPIEYWGELSDPALCAMGYCDEDTPYNNCFSLKVLDNITGKFVQRAWLPALVISPPIGFGIYWGHNISDFVPQIPTPSMSTIGTPSPHGG
jgi:hypothetical protein